VIVISDNSPLSALAEIGMLDLLEAVFGEVVIPASVAREACHPGAPRELRDWMSNLPPWVSIVADPSHILPEAQVLGAGEAAAITLASGNRQESLVILADLLARETCASLALTVIGTAGVLLEAANAGLIEFHDAMARLQETSFRLSPRIIAALERKLRKP
jgi:predicted nucleic acid-binding protein